MMALAMATLLFDENNYRQELEKDSEFAARRQEAFERFLHATELYAAQVEELREEEETAEPFVTWFYASLGACDLNAIDQDKQLASTQIPLIREALRLDGPYLAKRAEPR